MALIDKETICNEIERRIEENTCPKVHDDTEFSVWSAKDDLLKDILSFLDTLPDEQPKLKPKAIVIRPVVNLQKELMGVSAEVKDAVMLLLKDGWSLKAPDSEIEFDQRAVCTGFSSIPPKFKLKVEKQPVDEPEYYQHFDPDC